MYQGICWAEGTKRLIKCWSDEKGVRECGTSVPPEYSRNRIEVINEQGVVVQVIEATRTREELEREREREKLRKAEQAAITAQKRRDELLLQSYTNEKDLLTARNRTLEGIDGQITIVKNNLKLMRDNLDRLNHQAADHERNGTKPPQKLLEDIEKMRQDFEDLQNTMQKHESERESLVKRYENDLKRFRQLKRQTMF